MLHFAQTAIALVAAGASVLIVGGLVRETLGAKGRHLHLFPEAHNRAGIPVARPAETTPTNDAVPSPHSRRQEDQTRNNNERDVQRHARKKQRRNKKRDPGETAHRQAHDSSGN